MYKTVFKIALGTILVLVISYGGTPKPAAVAQERPTTAKALLARKDTAQTVVLAGRVTDRAGKPLPGANVLIRSLNLGAATDLDGNYKLVIPSGFVRRQKVTVECRFIGYQTKTLTIVLSGSNLVRDFALEATRLEMDAITVTADQSKAATPGLLLFKESNRRLGYSGVATFNSARVDIIHPQVRHNTEEYDKINDNQFLSPVVNPLSTFSIDVDATSYANVRRFLNQGQLPYKDAVRIEELINYFNYDYEDPTGEHPFSVTTEVSRAPWNSDHHLVHVGLQGKKLNYDEVRPSNLVFLVDVSGSMRWPNKLELLKKAFRLLVKNLDERDRVAIVTYAGAAGLVLPSTPATRKREIVAALNRLEAGGSTAGGAGIKLAYKVAKQNFIEDGNNRVILATDGDFNVGVSSTSELVRTIEDKRKDGIFLTICGFGMGNYKDGRMESISNAGNGNYYYIDNIKEANKVFGKEMRATLFTIAKDVKIQIEFNPSKVEAYRLIGYENRMLKSEDFNDDKKDAGELGAGHTVTALYEIIPAGVESGFLKNVDGLKYQKNQSTDQAISDELMTVKLRYKRPREDVSQLLSTVIEDHPREIRDSSDNFRFSAAVAEFGMLLRDSEFKGASSYSQVLKLAESAKGRDSEGYRAEFIGLVKTGSLLATASN